MSISDKIQLSLAIIAGISVILSLLGIWSSNKQIKIQKQQWEFSYKPVFKIMYVYDFDHYCRFILENPNNVYFKIYSVSYTDKNVELEMSSYGKISTTDGKTKEKTNYEGFYIALKKTGKEIPNGNIEIKGVDALGNKFIYITEKIEFDKTSLNNRFDIQGSYFLDK